MNHKVNIQARIKRHSRILKDNLWNSLSYSSKNNLWYKIVALLVLVLFPFYPAFATIWDTQTSFYRWDIDESSILQSYDLKEWEDLSNIDNSFMTFESKDSFLSVDTLVEEDVPEASKLIEYEVKSWDSLDAIAKKYHISKNTIIWANNLASNTKELKAWTKLYFPPVDWIVYKVKRGDTISSIARKYHIYTKDIITQNNIKNSFLKVGQKIILPWAKYIKEEKKENKKVLIAKKPYYTKKTYVKKTYTKKSSYITRKVDSNWLYPLKWHKPYSWAWWNCTWYVASYKKVDWRWNANQWLRNARKKWHATWNYAIPWAIVVLWGRWYNRRYWHVAIVRKVMKNYLIVSDMNYRRLWQITIRKIKRYWSHIRGYIYVD